ncbi:hypothetical protein BDQ12DRAFT_710962 [Crucibulum laeve]|uniref:Transmembrane protein n=1 Tax=Crucibulum laeve TaxID=68775 RepID=A0A5C3M6R3_9AGAR|nr:hypothetical protein BDQ12DRAFT_710962 [Crucibulum laeve]
MLTVHSHAVTPMTSSNFASFAPYAPPPDEPEHNPSPSRFATARPWFPTHASSSHNIDTSYQSGGIPTFGTSAAGGLGAVEETEPPANQWETRYGMRVNLLAAAAYLLGPISAFILLVFETQNDFVRFHAYQSALLTTPLVVLRILCSIFQLPLWIRTFFTLVLLACILFMSLRTARDASQPHLPRFEAPIIGPLAAQWLSDE